MKFNDYLRDRYEQLVGDSCSEQPFPIPKSVQRYFINAYAFEYVTAIRDFVGDARRILVIGDGGGRDYYSLKLLGKSPIVMDIATQSIIKEMVIADANRPLPFAPGTFDAVVMAEVLEHLPKDFDALRRMREVTKDGGALLLTIPYFHDAEPTHVRIHSPASIERILSAAGWTIDTYIEKGGGLCRVVQWLPLRLTIHGFNALLYRVRGRTAYRALNSRIAAFDFWLGRKRNSLHQWSKAYGAFIRCKKSDEVDWSALNCRAFRDMHLSSSAYFHTENKVEVEGAAPWDR
jgi:SAM-dependent methyltransferase